MQVSDPLVFPAEGLGKKLCKLCVGLDHPLALAETCGDVAEFAGEQVIKLSVKQSLQKLSVFLRHTIDSFWSDEA